MNVSQEENDCNDNKPPSVKELLGKWEAVRTADSRSNANPVVDETVTKNETDKSVESSALSSLPAKVVVETVTENETESSEESSALSSLPAQESTRSTTADVQQGEKCQHPNSEKEEGTANDDCEGGGEACKSDQQNQQDQIGETLPQNTQEENICNDKPPSVKALLNKWETGPSETGPSTESYERKLTTALRDSHSKNFENHRTRAVAFKNLPTSTKDEEAESSMQPERQYIPYYLRQRQSNEMVIDEKSSICESSINCEDSCPSQDSSQESSCMKLKSCFSFSDSSSVSDAGSSVQSVELADKLSSRLTRNEAGRTKNDVRKIALPYLYLDSAGKVHTCNAESGVDIEMFANDDDSTLGGQWSLTEEGAMILSKSAAKKKKDRCWRYIFASLLCLLIVVLGTAFVVFGMHLLRQAESQNETETLPSTTDDSKASLELSNHPSSGLSLRSRSTAPTINPTNFTEFDSTFPPSANPSTAHPSANPSTAHPTSGPTAHPTFGPTSMNKRAIDLGFPFEDFSLPPSVSPVEDNSPMTSSPTTSSYYESQKAIKSYKATSEKKKSKSQMNYQGKGEYYQGKGERRRA